MKVAFVGSSFGEYSGALKRAKSLSKKGVEVDIVFYYSSKYLFQKNGFSNKDASDSLYYQQVQLIKDSISGKVKLISADNPFDIKSMVNLFKYLRKTKPSAVFCHHSFISPLSAILSRLSGVKNIFMLEMSDIKRKNFLLRIVTSFAYLFTTRVVSISKATQSSMGFVEKVASYRKRTVIYNGVDFEFINNRDKSIDSELLNQYGLLKGKYIYYAGRFVKVKNIPLLINAFNNLKNSPEFENIKLVLSGSGPETPHIHKIIENYNLGDEVVITGNVPHEHVLSLMSCSNVYTMCSHSEGFSESIVQAMSLGKPIITTKNPSFEEALSGGCGMLVNNNAIDYSNGLKNILTDKKLRDVYSYKSVEKSYKYNINIIAKQYIDLIES